MSELPKKETPIVTVSIGGSVVIPAISGPPVINYMAWVSQKDQLVCSCQKIVTKEILDPVTSQKNIFFDLYGLRIQESVKPEPGDFEIQVMAEYQKGESKPFSYGFTLNQEQLEKWLSKNSQNQQKQDELNTRRDIEKLQSQLNELIRSPQMSEGFMEKFNELQGSVGKIERDCPNLVKKEELQRALDTLKEQITSQLKGTNSRLDSINEAVNSLAKIIKEINESLAKSQKGQEEGSSESDQKQDQAKKGSSKSDKQNQAKKESSISTQCPMYFVLGLILGLVALFGIIGLILWSLRDQSISAKQSEVVAQKVAASQEVETARRIQVESIDEMNRLKQQMEALKIKSQAMPTPPPEVTPPCHTNVIIINNNIYSKPAETAQQQTTVPKVSFKTTMGAYRRSQGEEVENCQAEVVRFPRHWSPTPIAGMTMIRTPNGYFYE